jgi:ketosteroid isomerase-like protein
MSTVQGTIAGAIPAWVTDTYRSVDHLDVDGFAAHLTDDVEFRFGNAPATTGKDAVREGLTQFFGAIAGMKHNFREVWEAGDDAVLVIDVDYTRLDGDVVTVPVVTSVHRRDGLTDSMQIFIDVSPALPG